MNTMQIITMRPMHTRNIVRPEHGSLTPKVSKLHPCRAACPALHLAAEAAPDGPDNSKQPTEFPGIHISHNAAPLGGHSSALTPLVPGDWQQQQHKGADQPQQLHTWTVFQQTAMLAAAAFAAAPLLLVLDVAEHACLAACQAKQILLGTQQTAAASHTKVLGAAAAVQQAVHMPASGSAQAYRQQLTTTDYHALNAVGHQSSAPHAAQHQRDTTPGTAAVHATNKHPNSNSSSSSSGSGTAFHGPTSVGPVNTTKVTSSSARPPILSLLPPWAAMAFTVLPLLLLLLRHLGNAAVLWPLCLCGASLMCQAYANLLLVIMQRASKRVSHVQATGGRASAAAAAAETLDTGSGSSTCLEQQQQRQQRTAALSASSSRGVQASAHGWWGESSCRTTGSSTGNKADSSSGSRIWAIATSCLFRMVQVLGDALRVWCVISACCCVVQQQAPAVGAAWSSCSSLVQQALGSSSSSGAACLPQVVAAAVAIAVKLQACVSGSVMLIVDVGLGAAGLGVYALALLARLRPIVDGLL